MCATCGCSDDATHTIHAVDGPADSLAQTAAHPHRHGHGHDHAHHHDHAHDHGHDHGAHAHDGHAHGHADHHHDGHEAEARATRTLRLEQEVLAKNNLIAERNRGWFEGRGVLALNLMSSPGAGKTTLLERTIRELGGEVPIAVIEGDQATQRDAERIRAAGCRVVQITTGTGCHLDAEMIAKGLQALAPPAGAVVMIENVGNLVCPALFDLGERAKVVIASVTEGEDKPLKYPHMFRAAQLMLLNKIDLLPHLTFDVDRCMAYARQVNPELRIVEVSATRGDGLATWYDWLRDERRDRPAIG
jgi:hydrogenase nickel incorporation protein HypB